MAKARPERIRLTLRDTVAVGSIRLDLPARRMWPVGLVLVEKLRVAAPRRSPP